MTAAETADYHALQIDVFRATEADLVSGVTLTYVEEAVGIARAAEASTMPVVISFTVETEGRLPSGHDLGSAIRATDAATAGYPAYYRINCPHPEHFGPALVAGSPWLDRVRGVQANASKKSHAELDAATDLDIGDPHELGRHYANLRCRLRNLNVLGGCCGTDHRHLTAICAACL